MTIYFDAPGHEIGVLFVWGMLCLAFPASLLVAGLITVLILLQEQFGASFLNAGGSYAGYLAAWLCFFTAGYAQWFVLAPWLWRRWKEERARNGSAA